MENNKLNLKDLLIIGAGPTGLFAGVYAGLRELSGCIIDSNNDYGGQPKYLFGDKFVYDFPGYVKITGNDIANNLYQQFQYNANGFGLKLNTEIINISRSENDNFFTVSFNNQEIINFKKILMTTGNGKFSPRQMPILKNQKFNNVFYQVGANNLIKNSLTIFGGGDSAIDWANHFKIKHPNCEINIIHRRAEFRAKTSNVTKAKKNNINFYNDYSVVDYSSNDQKVNSITIKHNVDQTLKTLNSDCFLIQYGQVCTPFKQELFNNLTRGSMNKISVNSLQETNINNFYAAGGCCTYPGKSHVLSSDLGDAVNAISAVAKALNPKLSPIFYTSVLKNKK